MPLNNESIYDTTHNSFFSSLYLRDILINSKFFPTFSPKTLYFINKYEPTTRPQQYHRWVHKVSAFYFFGPKTGDQNCFGNPKLNLNNHYS